MVQVEALVLADLLMEYDMFHRHESYLHQAEWLLAKMKVEI